MTPMGDVRTFRNEDLVLKVNNDIDPSVWDEARYEDFLDVLCGFREYQKDAIRTTLRFLLGGKYANLRQLAQENYSRNSELEAAYGSWSSMETHLQLPDQLSCSIDQATGTGKSYVLYGIAAILLAEGAVDRVLVLCPSNTIEYGLLKKFEELASNSDLRDLLPGGAKIATPRVIDASETLVEGSICVENYHAILENTKSSIRSSLLGKGARVAVLNDEAHHIANASGQTTKKWKEFLRDPAYGFRFVVGVSGTCYIGDLYFSDVVHRFSLREAIEGNWVKKVDYVDELPSAAETEEVKWQIVHNRHKHLKKQLRPRGIRPLTIVVTKDIAAAERVAEYIQGFLQGAEGIDAEAAKEKVLCVTSSPRHATNISALRTVDADASKVEWIVSVSMLSEGWDVKNVFQIVPHEERAFNSRLLIAQVLGRGLRRPNGWQGEEPVVTVFNHDSWSARIKRLVNEVLERERRLTTSVDPDSQYNFAIHQLDYTRTEDTSEYTKKGEYRLLEEGYVDLPTQMEAEDVSVSFIRAVTGEHVKFDTTIRHKVWTVEEIAEQMYQKLKAIDEESADAEDPQERTSYSKRFPVEKCEAIITESLKRAGITGGRITDDNRQKFWQALGTLRRKTAKRVVYKLSPKALVLKNTRERQDDSCSAAELRRGSKTVFVTPGCSDTLDEEQRQFFEEVMDEDGEFLNGRVLIERSADFRTAANLVIADATPERKFLRELTKHANALSVTAWLKNTAIGFYSIEYAWKKGTRPKRGEFNPDFFIKQGNNIFVVEIKGNEEIDDPSPENIKKFEYAKQHFARLNEWLERDNIVERYYFNALSPKSFDIFFAKMRDRALPSFRSELDIALDRARNTSEDTIGAAATASSASV